MIPRPFLPRAIFPGLLATALLAGCARAPRPGTDLDFREPPAVRVALHLGVDAVAAGSGHPFSLADQRGVLHAGRGGELLAFSREGKSLVVRDPSGREIARGHGPYWLRPDDHDRTVRFEGRNYPGHLVVRLGSKRGLNAINVVDLETYLRGVVPSEIGHAGGYFEAAKAQAVAARSYVVRHLNQYPEEGCDLRADTADQVYGAIEKRHPDSDRAVAETRGLVLVNHGRVIDARYSSTCGGKSADAREAFPDLDEPYLRARDDRPNGTVSCRESKYFRWEVEWTGEQLLRIFARTVPAATGKPWKGRRVTEVQITDRGPSDRVVELRIRTDAAEYRVRREGVRRVLERPEGGLLRSNAFDLDADRRDGTVVRLKAKGRGWGHGVGMCQYGAMQLSTEGVGFSQILKHYYPGTELHRIYR